MAVEKDTGTPQAKSVELLVAMTGKASPAKAAEGDKPVFAYIESLPEPQKSIAKHVDALAAKAIPDLKRAVKWGILLWRSRWVVLLFRRLRRSPKADVHSR